MEILLEESIGDDLQDIIVSFARPEKLVLNFMGPENGLFLHVYMQGNHIRKRQKTCIQIESTSLVIYNVKGLFNDLNAINE